MISPLKFINVLRESDKYIEVIYLNGGCYNFYLILKSLYSSAEAYIVRFNKNEQYNHVVTKISNRFYDITGDVTNKYYDRIPFNNQHSEVLKWNFSKSRVLNTICECCGEKVPIYFGE